MSREESPRRVSVVCWNVLADGYADYSKNHTWKLRAPLIRSTLLNNLADIVILQEIDHYEDFYRPLFEECGYCCEYAQRPEKVDGCLIAYRNVFALMSSQTIQFDDIAAQYPYSADKYLRHNVALLLKLQFDQTSFLVANCHLFWNPAFEEVKTAQARYLLQHIHAASSTALPTILGGDFNSFPETPPYFAITDPSKRISRPPPVTPSTLRFLCEPSLARLCRWLRVLGVVANTFDTNTTNSSPVDYNAIFQQCATEQSILLSSSKSLLSRRNCPPSHYVSPLHLPHALIYLYYTYPSLPLSRSQFLTICSKCGNKIEECQRDDDRITTSYLPNDRQIYICSHCHQTYWWNERINSTPARAMVLAKSLYAAITSALAIIQEYVEKHNVSYHMEFEQVRDILLAADFQTNITNWVIPTSTVAACHAEGVDVSEINELFEAREAALTNRSPTPEQSADSNSSVRNGNVMKTSSDGDAALSAASHPLKLQSAYLAYNKQEPPHTNWTHEFIG